MSDTEAAAHVQLAVVMPVFNAMPHLPRAVTSILEQTYADFEFIIHDDGSTDGSSQLLESWANRDPRIRLSRSKKNLGHAHAGNRAVEGASAPLIARMDADDISMPGRLERQLRVFEAHSDVGIVGSLCDVIDGEGNRFRGSDFCRLARQSCVPPFAHGSIMMRKSEFEAVGGYRQLCAPWEDLDLVLRMSRRTKILVIAESLYSYRLSSQSTRVVAERDRTERAIDLCQQAIDLFERGKSYEHILGREVVPRERVDPRVFISVGTLSLWAKSEVRLFGRLLHRGRLSLNRRTLAAIVWTAWAGLSPASLREFLQLFSRFRNALVRKPPAGGEVSWQPFGLVSNQPIGGVAE